MANFSFNASVTSGPSVKVRWQADAFRSRVLAEMNRRVRECLELVKGRIIAASQASAFASGPSAPGDYPNKMTGNFASSLVVLVDPSTLSGSLTSTSPHAEFLEEGTSSAGVIFPVRAKALSWVDYPSGVRHTAPYVIHRGIAARPAFQLAFAECKSRIRAILEAELPF